MPLVETYLVRFFFLIPLACALWVLLCAHVFFCCYLCMEEAREGDRKIEIIDGKICNLCRNKNIYMPDCQRSN